MEYDSQTAEWQYDDAVLDFSTPATFRTHGEEGSQLRSQTRRSTPDRSESIQPRPECCAYTIKWALCTMKKKRVFSLTANTIQNICLLPSSFWSSELKAGIEEAVTAEGLHDTHSPSRAQIIYSITERGVAKVEVSFRRHDIDWQDIDKQIKKWSDLVTKRQRELTVNISFIFAENTPQEPNNTTNRGGNATGRQFARRTRLQNNPDTAEDYATWDKAGQILGCPRDCKIGPYCWKDPETDKRYPVYTSVITEIFEYIKKGGTFETHQDMPPHLQQKILGMHTPTKRKKESPQIQIINHIPGKGKSPRTKRFKLSGFANNAINRYRDWHCAETNDEDWIADVFEIAAHTYEQRFRINCFSNDDIAYFESQGFKHGLSCAWVKAYDEWVEVLEEEASPTS